MKKLITVALIGVALASPSYSQEATDDDSRREKHRQHMEEKFKKADSNGDGQISESEFMARAKEKFQKIDADGNGQITKEEKRAMHEKMREKWKGRHGRHHGGDMPPAPPQGEDM